MVRVTRHILSKGPTGEYNKEVENSTGYDKRNSNSYLLVSIVWIWQFVGQVVGTNFIFQTAIMYGGLIILWQAFDPSFFKD